MISNDDTKRGSALTRIKVKPTLKDEEALGLIDKLVRPFGHQSERIAQEQLWLRCIAYFYGKQHFIQDGVSLREPTNMPEHRVLYKANKMLGNILRAVAKINTLSWEGSVAPVSDDAMDMYRAQLSDKILEHVQDVSGHHHARTMALLWAAVCGSGFTKIVWDPDKGDPDRFYLEDGKSKAVASFLSPGERQDKERKGLFEDRAPGEIAESVESPFSVFHDWSSREQGVEGCRWMASVSFISLEDAAERFGMDVKDIEREEPRLGPLFYEDAIAFMSTGRGGLNPSIPTPREKYQERCRIVDYFERPGRLTKGRGRHITTVGQRVIRNGENHFRATKFALPWVKWDWVPAPGRFWGIGLAEQLLNPQHNYNKARSTLIEFQNVYGHPPTFVPEGSGISTGVLTTAPGAVYNYNPAAGPIVFGKSPQLPKEVADNAALCSMDMQEISANTDPDASKLPAQIRSGAGLRAMMEEKHLVLHPVAEASIGAEKRASKIMLALAKINYSDQRVLRYQGNNGQWIVKHFSSIDINDDLRMTMDPARFQSMAQLQAEVMDLVQVGAINPGLDPEDKAAVRDAVHFNIGRDVLAEQAREAMNQDEEIEKVLIDPTKFTSGLPVNPWDDHAEHARSLRKFLRSDRRKQIDPFSLQVLVQHWMQHTQIVQQTVEANMKAAAMMRGGSGAKGQASQPSPI
jgi:hypothetical protein